MTHPGNGDPAMQVGVPAWEVEGARITGNHTLEGLQRAFQVYGGSLVTKETPTGTPFSREVRHRASHPLPGFALARARLVEHSIPKPDQLDA